MERSKLCAYIDSNYVQINNIPMASYKTASLREFYRETFKKHKRNRRLSGLSPSKTIGLPKTLAKVVLLNKFYY